MKSCQNYLQSYALLLFVAVVLVSAKPTPEPTGLLANETLSNVIIEDVIPDVENKTQKVIRVNPLDLPPLKNDPTSSGDSSLYNIQSLKPPHRNYVNSSRMRRPRPSKAALNNAASDSPIVRNFHEAKINKVKLKKQQQEHKQQSHQLHFSYNQQPLELGQTALLDKRMNVRVAPGAYPVFYAISRSNGHFGKYPLKGFRNQQDFIKYLVKNKVLEGAQQQKFIES